MLSRNIFPGIRFVDDDARAVRLNGRMTDEQAPVPLDARAGERGRLFWGIKASFREYVTSAEGTIGGSAVGEDGVGVFEERPVEQADAAALRYAGTLRFEAYGGMLSVQVDDPVVEFGETPLLRATTASGPVVFARLGPLPEAVQEGGLRVWRDVPAVLTPGAATILGGVYPPGTALDPVTFSSSTSA